jgi:nitrate reductase gamma subunit
MLIFWGFVGLFIGTTRLFIYTDILKYEWILWGQDFACDLSGIMLILGIIFAFFRRIISKTPASLTELEDGVMLLILFILGASGFLVEGARIALTDGQVNESAFFGIWIANFLKGIKPSTATLFWTVHSLASALFIAYIPFSKLWHTFTAPATLSMNPEKFRGD